MPSLKSIFKNASPSSPETSPGFCLWRVTLGYQRRVETELKPLQLTHLQYVVLTLSAWLNYTQGETSQRDVTAISGVQEAQVSLMVKALKTKGLVQQVPGNDPRVRLLSITSKGLTLLSKAMPRMLALQQEYWPAGAETDEMLRLLELVRVKQKAAMGS